MGWMLVLALALVTFAGLWFSKRCSRMALEMAAAAILIAVAGYAWQGSPNMAGQPVDRSSAAGS